jgi:hypothetical protein
VRLLYGHLWLYYRRDSGCAGWTYRNPLCKKDQGEPQACQERHLLFKKKQ